MVFWFSIQWQKYLEIARKALFTVNPMVSWALVYFYHIIKKYCVEHRKFAGWSNSPTKPYVGPHEHICKAPNQVLRHPPMRESMERKSWAFLQCINPGLHPNIFIDTHLLLKQTRRTELNYLFCEHGKTMTQKHNKTWQTGAMWHKTQRTENLYGGWKYLPNAVFLQPTTAGIFSLWG